MSDQNQAYENSAFNKMEEIPVHGESFATNNSNIEHTTTVTGMTYSWSDINVHVNKKPNGNKLKNCFKTQEITEQKHILKNGIYTLKYVLCCNHVYNFICTCLVTGIARPGQLLSIMGSSGAG